MLFAAALCWSQTGATYDAISDRVIRHKPPLPQIGRAGMVTVDPTYGTRILRVTDNVNTLPGNPTVSFYTTAGAFVNTWATDSRAFFIRSDKGYQLFSFNPQSLVAIRIGAFNLSGPIFSYRDPKLIYGVSGRSVKQYDYTTGVYTTLLDLERIVPGFPEYVGALSIDDSDTKLAVAFGGHQDTHPYIVVYNRSNGTHTLLNLKNSTIDGKPTNIPLRGCGVHSIMLDRSGRYLSTFLKGPYDGGYVWDLQTDVITKFTVLTSGHDVLGFGTRINQSGIKVGGSSDSMGFTLRSLATPNTNLQQLISPPPDEPYQWGAGGHWSWNNLKPGAMNPIVGSFYREAWALSKPWKAWDDEIVAVRTDGVECRVWRLAHHRSVMTSNFWDSPRGNVSQDGRFFLFTSNWEKTLGKNAGGGPRQDVFLLELPLVEPAPSTPPPPTQPPTQPPPVAAAPRIISMTPSATSAGRGTFWLTVRGSGFVSKSVIRWNGRALTTRFVSSAHLTTIVPGSYIASRGTAYVSVANPGPVVSNSLPFKIYP